MQPLSYPASTIQDNGAQPATTAASSSPAMHVSLLNRQKHGLNLQHLVHAAAAAADSGGRPTAGLLTPPIALNFAP